MKTLLKICYIFFITIESFAIEKKDYDEIQKLDTQINLKNKKFFDIKSRINTSWRDFNQNQIISFNSLVNFAETYQKELGLDDDEVRSFASHIIYYYDTKLDPNKKIYKTDLTKSVGDIIMKRQIIEGLKVALYGCKLEELDNLIVEDNHQLNVLKLSYLNDPTTLFLYYEYYRAMVNDVNRNIISDETLKQKSNETSIYFLNLNLVKIQERMEYILNLKYCQYKHASTSKKALKAINLSTDNDFFGTLFKNEDRNMTGAGKLEFTTDLLKMRLIKSINSSRILSYQSLYYGIEIHTPMIRFDNQDVLNLLNSNNGPFALPNGKNNTLTTADLTNPKTGFYTEDALDAAKMILNPVQSEDRPFSSFSYIGRSKYRLNINGFWRVKSDFKVGKIGGLASDNIQALLHRDLITGSRRVLNWDKRIAAGGRTVFNIDHTIDLMAFSKQCYSFHNKNISQYINFYVPVGLHFGSYYTGLDVGIGYSNRNFKQLSGNNEMNLVQAYNKTSFGTIFQNLVINTKFSIQNVIHSTSMEGFGFLKTSKDDPNDDENISVYTINKIYDPNTNPIKTINVGNLKTNYVLDKDNAFIDAPKNQDFLKRLIWKWDTQLGFRLNKATFYYNLNIGNAEFLKKESKKHPIYGYGRIGLMFYL